MFKSFFFVKKWFAWSWCGLAIIFLGTGYQVYIDVKINEWFGTFYNIVQIALTKPGSVDNTSYFHALMELGGLAMMYVMIAVLLNFFSKHWVFRWREAMNDFYVSQWQALRKIEGASQRVQEDTKRFATIVESLGASIVESVMTLFAFLPILWVLSESINFVPIIGNFDHALVFISIIFALFGTLFLAIVGFRLPGLEFNNQKVEAAYRKELVYAEDDERRGEKLTLMKLFLDLRKNYFRLYFHYLYFDIARYSYLQIGVVVPYLILGPTIVAGVITLGLIQQIVRAFERILGSFQFLVRNWPIIVELISVYKRLSEFERVLTTKNSS
jgi:peptide/bleomycin uptake transporter